MPTSRPSRQRPARRRPVRRNPAAPRTFAEASAARRPEPDYSPGAGPLRRRVERASGGPLVWIANLPLWVPPLAMGALLLAGMLVPWSVGPVPVGSVLVAVVAAVSLWLAYVSWPSLTGNQRFVRALVVAALFGAVVLVGTDGP